MQSGDGVRPRLPGGKRIRQGAYFLFAWTEAQLGSKLPNNRRQYVAIGLERTLLRTLLKIPVHLQRDRIVNRLPVRQENGTERGENAGFPVDQGSVAVECKDLKSGEIEHGAILPIVTTD